MEEFDIVLFDDTLDTYADFFAIKLQEQFPEIDLELMETAEERRGWVIYLPTPFPQREALVNAVIDLRDRLFWDKDALVAYTIKEAKKGRRS